MSDESYPSFVQITNREVYDKLVAVDNTVQNMDGRLNSILAENVSLGKRVRSLELKFYSILAGLIGAATLFFAGMATGVTP